MIDHGALYRDARERCIAVVREHVDAAATPVPACPGWDVHDVVAHLVGGLEDRGGSGPGGIPTPDDTARQVARARDVPLAELLDRWEAMGPAVDEFFTAHPEMPLAGPAIIDATSHEHDVRGALGVPGGRDSPAIRELTVPMLRFLDVPVTLVVRLEDAEVCVEPRGGATPAVAAEPITLTTTRYEAFRWRMGRRSVRQMAGMHWSADPTPLLPHLCVFGPSPVDIVE